MCHLAAKKPYIDQVVFKSPPLYPTSLFLQDTLATDVATKVCTLAFHCQNVPALSINTGHWIQACPTNNDPTFDGRPKFRRTTGIPRSFLKVVEKPTALTGDGTVDVSQLPAGVMYTSTGEWVVAEPDKASWEQFQAKTKASADKAEAISTDNQELRDRGLECPIDKRLFVDPMKTPCCGQTYCRDCIEEALLGNDFVCPGCATDNVLVDNLTVDEDMVKDIKTYEEERSKSKSKKDDSASPTPERTGVQDASKTSKSPSPMPATAVNGTTSASLTPQMAKAETKKRPAEDELDNKRIPTGPAAMRMEATPSQNSAPSVNDQNFIQQMNAMAQGLPPNQGGMNPFAGFPGMNGMGFPIGMPGMGMNMGPMMGMPNPMMMGAGGGGWQDMGGMNGMGFSTQQQNMYGGGFNPMMNGQQQWHGNQGWGMPGMNGSNQHMQQGGMPNQMRAGMNGNADGGAYMRQPVNPQRHQARNNRKQRPADYREM